MFAISDVSLDQALNGPEKMQWQQAIDREITGYEPKTRRRTGALRRKREKRGSPAAPR